MVLYVLSQKATFPGEFIKKNCSSESHNASFLLTCMFGRLSQEKANPVKREKLSETSPAFKILSTDPR